MLAPPRPPGPPLGQRLVRRFAGNGTPGSRGRGDLHARWVETQEPERHFGDHAPPEHLISSMFDGN